MDSWVEEELRSWREPTRPPRRRVMVGLAVPVVVGMAVGIAAPLSPPWYLGAAAVLLFPLFLWIHRKGSSVLLLAVLFLLAAAHARQQTGMPGKDSLATVLPRPMEYMQLRVVATEDAVARIAGPGRASGAVFHARATEVNRDGRWRRVVGRIRVVLRGSMQGRRLPRYGELWNLHGIVRPALPRRNGLFVLPENQAVVDPDRAEFVEAGLGNPVKAWCMHRRRVCRRILGRGLEDYPKQCAILQALLLGYRSDLPRSLRDNFAVTGTVHIFAISGAHVGMMLLLFAGLLRLLRVPVTRWFWVLIPLLALYTLTTGAATSAIRASVMASLILVAPALKRRPDTLSALAAAAILILLVSPAQLGDLGFVLSFTAVGGLLAVQPVMEAAIRRWTRPDPWALPGEPVPGGKKAWRNGAGWALRGTSVSLSAWVSTMPLTAFFFNLFSPVALLMNLVVIPVVFLILLAGVMSLLCSAFGTFCSEVFNHASRVLATGLLVTIRWAAEVPFGHGYVRSPAMPWILGWYGVLSVSAITARRLRGVLPVGFGVLAIGILVWGLQDARRCRISVLDVGEGNAVLVQAGRGRVLVDCGPVFRAEETLRQLRAAGVNQLDALVLSHADSQHVGAAGWLMRRNLVRELWMPQEVWPTVQMKEILHAAEERNIPVRRLSAGDCGDWPEQFSWEVLWPPADRDQTVSDAGSLVMRVSRCGVSLLLAGDLGGEEENVLIDCGLSLDAPLLLAGRHGDASATSGAWLDAVHPREVLISAGPQAEERHPDREVMERLEIRGMPVWITERDGVLQIDLHGCPARWPDPGYQIAADPG